MKRPRGAWLQSVDTAPINAYSLDREVERRKLLSAGEDDGTERDI